MMRGNATENLCVLGEGHGFGRMEGGRRSGWARGRVLVWWTEVGGELTLYTLCVRVSHRRSDSLDDPCFLSHPCGSVQSLGSQLGFRPCALPTGPRPRQRAHDRCAQPGEVPRGIHTAISKLAYARTSVSLRQIGYPSRASHREDGGAELEEEKGEVGGR